MSYSKHFLIRLYAYKMLNFIYKSPERKNKTNCLKTLVIFYPTNLDPEDIRYFFTSICVPNTICFWRPVCHSAVLFGSSTNL